MAGCSSGSGSDGKVAFCGDKVQVDRGASGINSPQDFVLYFQRHGNLLTDLKKHAPNGKIGQEAQALAGALQLAARHNDTSVVNNPAVGQELADLDTYCGVEQNGNPLPSYFTQGKGSAFCSAETLIGNGIGSSPSAADIVTFLQGHQAELNTFGAGIPGLPSALQSEAQGMASAAHSAIQQNNGSLLQAAAIESAGNDFDLYCGVNH